jgi:ribosome maturation factor RimP
MDLDPIREAAERVAHSLGLEIFDVEWKVGRERFLRVYIDRPPQVSAEAAAARRNQGQGAGVTHNDCQAVSEQLSVLLDVEDLVPGPSYTLEVSSPGLDRKLIKPGDYERFAGRLAKIWLNEPVENEKFFQGRLAGYADGMVKLTVRDREVAVPFAGIRKANLVVEL